MTNLHVLLLFVQITTTNVHLLRQATASVFWLVQTLIK